MFKDYSTIAQASANEATIGYQAFAHGKLVSFLKSLSALIITDDLVPVYGEISRDVRKVFEKNCKKSTVQYELSELSDTPRPEGTPTFHRTHSYYYYSALPFYSCNDLPRNVGTKAVRLITDTMLSIAKKEVYIEYKSSETEEIKEIAELSDVVAVMTRKLDTDYYGCELYKLSYKSNVEREGSKGFIHQVMRTTSDGINTIPEIVVDKHWIDTVYNKNLAILEYEGNHAFVISACPNTVDSDKIIYNARIVQIQGTREERLLAGQDYGYGRTGDNTSVRKLFKVKDVAISVSSEGKHWAVGSSETRAVSTMRRRQKAEMIKSLNL